MTFPLALAAAALGLGLTGVPAAAFETPVPLARDRSDEPTTVLVREALAGTEIRDAELAGVLIAAEPGSRRALLEILASLAAESRDGGERPREETHRRLAQLGTQTARMPRWLAARLRATDGRDPNLARIVTAGLDVAAMLGGPADIEPALALAGPWPKDGAPRTAAHPEALTAALEGILERSPEAHRPLRQAFRTAPGALRPAIVDALGSQAQEGAARSLVHCLGVDRPLDGQILNRLQGVSSRLPVRLHTTELAIVRRYLRAERPFVRAQAALCLGHLDDIDATPDLIELLDDPNRSVVQNAHWSLTRLAAMTMGPDARRWRGWYAEQADAWAQRSGEFLAALDSDDPAEIVRALRTVSLLRLHREALAPALERLLERNDASAPLTLGCAAVESLRATDALPAVAELLAHPSPEVRASALRTLRVVTGRDLPGEVSVWRKATRGSPSNSASSPAR